MIHRPRAWRVFAEGTATAFLGAISVMVIAAGEASADPVIPVPPTPAPAPAQHLPVPSGGASNRLAPAPPGTLPAVMAPTPVFATTPAAEPAAMAPTPAVSGTLRDYLQAKGVKLEPQVPQECKALGIILPIPPRWTQVADPNVPDAFAVIADRVGGNSVYTSNAQVVVYKLIGDFDPAEAITHGYVDSQQLLAWNTTNASLINSGGFPAAVIEGTYRENNMTLNTSRRYLIATSGTDKYLVSLVVTTAASQAVADAPATDAIINGFRVTAPGAANYSPPVRQPERAPAQQPAPNLLALVPGLLSPQR